MLVYLLVLAIAHVCAAQTQEEEPITGKSATGNLSWEIRPPTDNRSSSTIWLWPDDQKEKAAQLGGPQDAWPLGVEFSPNDEWIVVPRHLSSGNFFSFYQKRADGNYAQDSAGGEEEPVAGFFKVEKTVFNDQAWDSITLQAYQAYINANVFSPSGVTGATLYHEPADALAYNFPVSGHGWNSGDLTTLAGGTGWHMTLDQVLAVMSTFRRSGTIMSPADAQTMLDDGFGLNWTVTTQLGTYYAKIGGWSGDGGRMEQSIAFFLPQQMEFVLFVNSPIAFAAPGQLLSYGDAGTPGNVSDPVIVGVGGWEVFKFLFACSNSVGQDRIYATNTQGQLLSYGDSGTPGNVSDPVIVGSGGWEVFQFLFAGRNLAGQDRIYGVLSSAVTLNGVQYQKGQLLSYGDTGTPGNVSDPVVVGFGGWTDFQFLFAGNNSAGQDRIYGVWAIPTSPPGQSLYSIVSSAYTNNIVEQTAFK